MERVHSTTPPRTRLLGLTLGGLLLVLGLLAAAPISAASGDRLLFSPATGAAGGAGSTVVLHLFTNTVTPMSGVQASIHFDRTALQISNVARPAGYWGSAPIAGGDDVDSRTVANGGTVTGYSGASVAGSLGAVAAYYLTGTHNSPSGDVPFLDITFQVLACPASGSAPVTLPIGPGDAAFLQGGTSGQGSYGNQILPLQGDVTNATVTCTPSASPSASHTASPTPSHSASASPTPGQSSSPSTSATGSPTGSASSSANASPSTSATATTTANQSASQSPGPSASASASPTPAATLPPGNSLRISPAATTTAIGGTFTVKVVQSALGLTSGAQATVTFDKTLLQVTTVAYGSAYSAAPVKLGAGASSISAANTSGSLQTVAASGFPPFSVPAGDQDLLVITFHAVACGQSALGLPIGPADGALLDGTAATYGAPLTLVGTAGGSVSISCTPAQSVAGATGTGSTPPPTSSGLGGTIASSSALLILLADGVLLAGLVAFRLGRRPRW